MDRSNGFFFQKSGEGFLLKISFNSQVNNERWYNVLTLNFICVGDKMS